jgi:hypothetical protein
MWCEARHDEQRRKEPMDGMDSCEQSLVNRRLPLLDCDWDSALVGFKLIFYLTLRREARD